MQNRLETHIVQTPEWGEFKRQMGTPPVRVGDIQFTKHSIPGLPYYVGYAPRVNFLTQKFSWSELRRVAKQEKCILIRFDVPNVIKSHTEGGLSGKVVKTLQTEGQKSKRETFAKCNVLLDISLPEEVLIANMHSKTRYNSKLASRKGVTVKLENNNKGIKIFNQLQEETAKRQKYSRHSSEYYSTAFNTLNAKGMANILIAYYEDKPLAAWMLFNHGKTFYYPYGGSSTEHKNLMASNLIAWEAIKLGKKLGCELFDMWGATNDRSDAWWGFTNFKLGYGGDLVEYIDSYDLVTNKPINFVFNTSYNSYWKIKEIKRKLI